MITSPGRKINRYYDNFQSERERDEASNQPLIDETDVVEFFKHLGFQATVYQEKLLRDKSPVHPCSLVEAERQEPRHGSSRTLQRSLKERVQSCYCCAEQAAEPEDGRQDLQTLVEARTGCA